MAEIIHRFRKWLGANRLARLEQHYRAIQPEIKPQGRAEEAEFHFFMRKFQVYRRRTKRLARLRIFLYLFLYASVTVNVLKAIPLLSFLVGFVELGSAIIGTTVALALVFWLTAKINLHLQLMGECLSHLVALYHRNPRRDASRAIKKLQLAL